MTDTITLDKKIPRDPGALCTLGCDGDPCFCAFGNDMMKSGITALKKSWPGATDTEAAATIADLVLQEAYRWVEKQPAAAEDFAKLLIAHVVHFAFQIRRGAYPTTTSSDDDFNAIDALFQKRMKDEAAARAAIESVLDERLRTAIDDEFDGHRATDGEQP